MVSNDADPKIRGIPDTDQVMCRWVVGSCTLDRLSLVAFQKA
jgi:hypothetical protein